MKIFGHRGAAGLVLENTLASIRKALELQVDGIEFDVRASKDGQPVIIHDATLERTHQVEGKVAELTIEEIRKRTKHHEYPIPSLSEVMPVIGQKVPTNVELKEVAAVAPTLRVLDDLTAANVIVADEILITSFEHSAVSMVRDQTEHYKLGLLTREIPDRRFWQLAKSLDVHSVNISSASVNAGFVKQAHNDGRLVMVYTVNDRMVAERLEQMGVDAIFSDVPEKVRRV